MFVVVQADLLYILDLAQLFADDDAIKQVLSDPVFTELAKSDPEIEHRVQIVRLFQAKEYKKIVELIERIPSGDRTPEDITSLGRALKETGLAARAIELINVQLIDDHRFDQRTQLVLRYRRARLLMVMNRDTEALQDLTFASAVSDALEYWNVSALIMQDFAMIAMSSGDPVKAITYAERALLYVKQSNVLTHKYVIQKINLASFYVQAGRLNEALEEYIELSTNEIVLSSSKYSLVTFLNLAITYKRLGDHTLSVDNYQRVLETARTSGEAEYLVRALIGITDHFVITGDIEEAKRFIQMAIDEVKHPNALFLEGIVNVHYANVEHALGLREEAIARLRTYYDKFNAEQSVQDTVLYGTDLADWLSEVGRYDEAFTVLKNCSTLQKSVYDQEIERTTQLSSLRSKLDVERESIRQRDEARTAVLHSVLPAHIAQRLLAGERKIGERINGVTILFADVVGFTQMSTTMEPEQLVDLLEDLFTRMDQIAIKHGCERIKTIGDSYMAACGLADATSDHAERICRTALAFLDESCELPLSPSQLRIGIHTGPVVAGVMSGSKLSYDIWGDTVNVASRMENHSAPGRILCTSDVANALGPPLSLSLEKREPLDIRGKGLMTTYWLR